MFSHDNTIDAKALREVLSYDPETGIFRWLITLSNRAKAGAIAGSTGAYLYRRIVICGCIYVAHRLAWVYMTGRWPVEEIDHRNGDPDDNKWSNLREATHSQNLANRKITRGVAYKGVRKQRSRYSASIRVLGKHITLGTFDTPIEAHAAYCVAAAKYFGAFARTQ